MQCVYIISRYHMQYCKFPHLSFLHLDISTDNDILARQRHELVTCVVTEEIRGSEMTTHVQVSLCLDSFHGYGGSYAAERFFFSVYMRDVHFRLWTGHCLQHVTSVSVLPSELNMRTGDD